MFFFNVCGKFQFPRSFILFKKLCVCTHLQLLFTSISTPDGKLSSNFFSRKFNRFAFLSIDSERKPITH